MSITPNMNLDLPTPSVTPGPTWAQSVNTAFDAVDAHDHSSGKGPKITPAGMNIIADLAMQNNNLTEARTVRFQDAGTVPATASDVGCLVVVAGDLWYVNATGTGVQITSGAGLSFASLGTIGGDFAQPGVTASVTYSDTTKTFSFLRASGSTAELYCATINLADPTNGSLSVEVKTAAGTAAYSITLPIAAPTNDSVLTFASDGQGTFRTIQGTAGEVSVTPSASAHTVSLPSTITKNLTFSGNNTQSGTNTHSGSNTFSGATSFTGSTSGRGIVPLCAVLATFPSLAGAYNCTAVPSTGADANGFVQCNGQTLVDATSPMNGATIPNINNDVFLMGNTTSGVTGGSNSKALSTGELPSHSHSIDHGHSNTFGLTGTTTFASTSHLHNMAHTHQVARLWESGSNAQMLYNYARNATLGEWDESTAGGSLITAYNERLVGSGSAAASMQFQNLSTEYTFYTSGGLASDGGDRSLTDGPSSTASVGFSGSVTSHSGSSGSTGSGSSFDIRPSYITARYVMRVK
jgi:hypothetical protein